MNKELMEAGDIIKARGGGSPDIALILGSGLSSLAEELENTISISYGDLPGFPVCTAPGHASQMLIGDLEGHRIMVFKGRFHYFEGYEMAQIVHPIRFLKVLGCSRLLLTNAAGGVNRSFSVGNLMLITDHINFTGQNPLIGKNDEEFGPRFPDMSYCWSGELNQIIRNAATNRGISLQEGVYIWFTGPSFETPAEIRMASIIGGDAVGMSTVPEAITATYCGIQTAGISCISNMAAGILDQPITAEEVIESGVAVSADFKGLIKEFLRLLPNEIAREKLQAHEDCHS